MTIETCAGLYSEHIVQDIALDPGRTRQRHRVGFDLPHDFPVNEAVIGNHGTVYPARFADGQLCTMDIAGQDAVDLDFSITHNISGDLHSLAQDRRSAGRPFLAWIFIL